MAMITTTIAYVDLEGDYGSVEGVEVTCNKCGHSEESFGTSEASLLRCAVMLKENCPKGERNFYDVGE